MNRPSKVRIYWVIYQSAYMDYDVGIIYSSVIWATEPVCRGVDGWNGTSGSVMKGQWMRYSRAQAHAKRPGRALNRHPSPLDAELLLIHETQLPGFFCMCVTFGSDNDPL
jgi:hypothetical protein